jgi:hypothetical protein
MDAHLFSRAISPLLTSATNGLAFVRPVLFGLRGDINSLHGKMVAAGYMCRSSTSLAHVHKILLVD